MELNSIGVGCYIHSGVFGLPIQEHEMNRTIYWISHIILAIIVVAALVLANLVHEIQEEDPALKDEYTSFWVGFFVCCGVLALIWWFGVVRGRMQNMGFPPWACWLWSHWQLNRMKR